MSTSLIHHGFGIRGYHYLRTEYVGGEIHITIRPPRDKLRCAACRGRRVVRRGGRPRRFRGLPIGKKRVWICLAVPRLECKRWLEEALALNAPLAAAYYLKEDLRRIWTQPTKEAATRFLDVWIARARSTGIRQLQQMANTLSLHRVGVLAYYDVPITTGPLEGTNNKIKTL
ncbi:MAG: transposase [Gemmatimonadota bacterium]